MKPFFLFTLLVVAATLPVGAAEPPLVVVSIPPQQWLVERLAREQIDVRVLLPPGSSPATYDPSPRQLTTLTDSALFLTIGVPFEGAVVPTISDLMPEVSIVDTGVGVHRRSMTEGHDHEHHSLGDPHIWLDPVRMKIIAATTAEALKGVLPSSHAAIDSRLQALHQELDSIDRRVAEILQPVKGREILVFHPAYGYFTDRYQLIQVAIEVEGKSPTGRHLASIIDRFGGRKAPAVFVQPQFSAASAQRVADALGCAVVKLDPLASDYTDNLEIMATLIATELGDRDD